jgi:hypothetical protein
VACNQGYLPILLGLHLILKNHDRNPSWVRLHEVFCFFVGSSQFSEWFNLWR